MATAQDVEQHVPIREGDYGERVATVEPGGVEYIALKERHGKPIDLFWTWLSPNLEFATVYVGVLGVAVFGLSFWQTALAIVVGRVLGHDQLVHRQQRQRSLRAPGARPPHQRQPSFCRDVPDHRGRPGGNRDP